MTRFAVRRIIFTAKRVQASVGDTVAWKNNGALSHTATDTKGAWNTAEINGPPHPWMIGQVIVQ